MLEDETPQRLGRYEILTRIASGGMARVYAGRILGESGFSKLVAVKVMLEELVDEDRFVAMFLDEARVAAHVSHPHVVGMLDLGRDARGVPYLVMDLVLGASVAQLLKGDEGTRPEAMPIGHAVEVAAQVAEGLHAAHEAQDTLGTPLQIVHRDVSPQNILVGVDGRARITDFGVARAVARLTQTKSGEVKGKARYFSPEQALGRVVDRRSDLFSLGVVLWEALTLRPLFQGKNMLEVHKAVVSQPIPDVRELRPEVPAEIAKVLRHALEREVSLRIASGAELARALRAAAERTPLTLPSPPALAAYVQARAGRSIASLTAEIRDRTAALDIDVAALTGPLDDELGAGFDDEEPTAIDDAVVQQTMKGRSATARPGMARSQQFESLAEPITSSSSTLTDVAPAAPQASLPEPVDEESSVANTLPRLPNPGRARLASPQSARPTSSGATGPPIGLPPRAPAPAPARAPVPTPAPSPAAAAAAVPPPARAPVPTPSPSPAAAAAPAAVPPPASPPVRATASAPLPAPILARPRAEPAMRSLAIAALGYVALASGGVGLVFDLFHALSSFAVAVSATYFALVATRPTRRSAMGIHLPLSAACASLGLLLGLVPLVLWALAISGLAPLGLTR